MLEKLWLDLDSLKRFTDLSTWKKGTEIYENNLVLSIEIQQSDSQEWSIFGRIKGTHPTPYKAQVTVKLNAEKKSLGWSSTCTCPVHRGCKHGMSLLIYASHHGLELLKIKDTQGQAEFVQTLSSQLTEIEQAKNIQKIEVQRIQAEYQLLSWFKQVDQVNAHAFDESNSPSHELYAHQTSQPPQHCLYLLKVVHSSTQNAKLHLDTVMSYRKKRGGWAKPRILKSIPNTYETVYKALSTLDLDILRLISAIPREVRYYSDASSLSVTLQGRLGLMALELAASTGRLLLTDSQANILDSVEWGAPRPLTWSWNESNSQKLADRTWSLAATIEPNEATTIVCMNSPPLFLDRLRNVCGPVTSKNMSIYQIEALFKAPPLDRAMIDKYQDALIARLDTIPKPPILVDVPLLKGLEPKGFIELTKVVAGQHMHGHMIDARLSFNYDGINNWWGNQPAIVSTEKNGVRSLLQRNIQLENSLIELLTIELNLDVNETGRCTLAAFMPQVQWAIWFDQEFFAFKELGFTVVIDESLKNFVAHTDQVVVDMVAQDVENESTSSWFDLSLGIDINGKRHNILPYLPRLLAQANLILSSGQPEHAELPKFIYLSDDTNTNFFRIPTATLKPWLETMLEFFTENEKAFSGEHLTLSRFEAMRTGTLLGEGIIWKGAESIRSLSNMLKDNALLENISAPKSVNASLRSYQQDGLNWLQFLRKYGLGGILADDMGLGKTLQTLTHIQVEKDAGRLTTPALIIVPVSLLGNWQRETERFCPQLRTLIIHGKDRHSLGHNLEEIDIVIAPYSLLQRDRIRWLDTTWHLVVLDEAQNIKNTHTQSFQVARELKANQRLCLSGTPIENHLGEIWSLFHFLMPGFLGSQKRFGELFRTPIEKQNNVERLKSLRARITPFMLRRTKSQVADELPDKIESTIQIELSGKQADLYETIRLTTVKTVRDALSASGFAKSRITILDALLKLRQVCCDPRLVKTTAAQKILTSAKLSYLMDVLPKMLSEGRRILLFSQFTSMLSLIETELSKQDLKWVKLTGQSKNRDAIIEQFTSGEFPLFLISLKAGGVGLNLPQADTVIHYDPWWNPAVENQATDRAHRIGQTKNVWVLKLVAQGTIEERIQALQANKAALAQSMYSDAIARKTPLFTENDLADLLKPLAS